MADVDVYVLFVAVITAWAHAALLSIPVLSGRGGDCLRAGRVGTSLDWPFGKNVTSNNRERLYSV